MLTQAADKGHASAQLYLAQIYRSGDADLAVLADAAKAAVYLDKAATQKQPDALFALGDMHLHGTDGRERDLTKALAFFEAAGDAGSADALCSAGAMYYNGVGVPSNFERAFELYQRAAEQNSLPALRNLAAMYVEGKGTPQSIDMGVYLWKVVQRLEQQQQQQPQSAAAAGPSQSTEPESAK